jgi:phage terminase small subunit
VSWKRITERGTDDLNAKQLLYVSLYLDTLDGTLSAQLAGYSKKSAADRSKDLQRNPKVREAIDKGLLEKEQTLKDKCIKTMEHAYAQATADIGELFDDEGNPLPLSKMPRDARRAIQAIEVEFEYVTDEDGKERRVPKLARIKLHDKRASQELFAKFADKLKEKVQLDATQSYADMVLAAQRKREGDAGNEPAALPAHAEEEPEE